MIFSVVAPRNHILADKSEMSAHSQNTILCNNPDHHLYSHHDNLKSCRQSLYYESAFYYFPKYNNTYNINMFKNHTNHYNNLKWGYIITNLFLKTPQILWSDMLFWNANYFPFLYLQQSGSSILF